ncbi:hypothetical protein EIP91_002891 [Steccherinum ochraceum]|uniref:Amidohydrolase-related domain-containing protein n=1 Tax=Steccherinum ochraceum TaxID=92696 RepID=A0A4R0RV62_9APHY|nr:hypothetical protein EIP91_002891 [Steccherinum ochraceum]
METTTEGDIAILNVHLPFPDPANAATLFNVTCKSGRISSVTQAHLHVEDSDQASVLDVEGQGVLLPSFCHAHIHLDKCFLLEKCDPLETGDFQEALHVTARAKNDFSHDLEDLYNRGKRLILRSVESGVTSMRAHVEVDKTVQNHCLQVGLRLREDLKHLCDVQIAAFAQDPLFSEADVTATDSNLSHFRAAVATDDIGAIGSAPYVEDSEEHAQENIRLVLDLAFQYHRHADFHLDYNLDSSKEPLIRYLLDELQERIATHRWHAQSHVCVGHATRLTLFTDDEWIKYQTLVRDHQLPVTLVGLPQSDLYMMGRNLQPVPRGTLNVVQLERKHGIHVAMAVNNVQNAFTPQGPPDPLALCSLGVAIFQAATPADCQSLVRSVTASARQAVGQGASQPADSDQSNAGLVPQIGDAADFVILQGNNRKTEVLDLDTFHPFLAWQACHLNVHKCHPVHFALLHRIVNDVGPDVPPVPLGAGKVAKLVMVDDRGPKNDTTFSSHLTRWCPNTAGWAAFKLRLRLMTMGWVLPTCAAVASALFAVLYTSAEGDEGSLQHRLTYRTSPITDFGICRGSVQLDESKCVRLAFFSMKERRIIEDASQDMNDHYWFYFTSLKGEEVYLDTGLFALGLPQLIETKGYPPIALDNIMREIPCTYGDRSMKLIRRKMWSERSRMSVLRNTALQESMQHPESERELLRFYEPFFAEMESLAGRPMNETEQGIFMTMMRTDCYTLRSVLEEQRWKQYPKVPPVSFMLDTGTSSVA